MFGKGRGYDKPEFKKTIENFTARYESLIFDHALNPLLLDSFRDRLSHARNTNRDPQRFLDEEFKEFQSLEASVQKKEQAASMRDEARRRRLAGESFADKVLDEYRQRIEHYQALKIHPEADAEVAKIYGAMRLLDSQHWGTLESYLRRVFPQAGQLDRMNIEQRFWRLVPSRKDRVPEALERYQRTLSAPSATKKEKVRVAQDTLKEVAFFLHELLELCERARQQAPSDDNVDRALGFIRKVIEDFRIKDLKKR